MELVVPYWANKDLKKHANKKASEVREEHLKHAANNFSVSILTGDDFAVEGELLAQLDLYQFDATAPLVSPSDLAAWMAGKTNLTLVANLTRKAALIGANKSSHLRESFRLGLSRSILAEALSWANLNRSFPRSMAKSSNTRSHAKQTSKPSHTPLRKSLRSSFSPHFKTTKPNCGEYRA